MTTLDEAPLDLTFEERARRVDDAAAAVASMEDEVSRATAVELREAIESFHRPALITIVQRLRDDPRGKELLFELVDDPNVRAMLALHGIIKADPATRAMQALALVRPYLQSHGGDVELVELRESIAVVRLLGSCNGCSMSAVTLREGVEEALVKGVEEITGIEVVEDEPTAAFIPLGAVGRRDSGSSGESAGWVTCAVTSDVPDGSMHRVDMPVRGQDESFVITNVEQRFAAFRNACVHQGMTLDGGLLSEGVITCPWHGFTFEATTGECISAPGAQLEQIPLRLDGDQIMIRVDAG